MFKPSKKQVAYIFLFFLVAQSFYILGARSNGLNPTIDEQLGIFNFQWGNFSQGVDTQNYYRNGENLTAWIESISGGVTDHGDLTGLGDDDHSIYLLQDGSEKSGIDANWIELGGENKSIWPTGGSGVLGPYYLIVYKSGSTYYAEFDNGTILDSGSDADDLINNALLNATGQGSVYLKSGIYQVDGTIYMVSGITLIIENGVLFNMTVPSETGIDFDGVTNAHIIVEGNATYNGYGDTGAADADVGLRVRGGTTFSSVVAIGGYFEFQNFNLEWFVGNDFNYSTFERLYGHDWSRNSDYAWHGMRITDCFYNDFVDIISDGVGWTRCPLVLDGSIGPVMYNNIIGGEYRNSDTDNGIYLGGWLYKVWGNKLIGVTTRNNTQSGHCGIKLRPASHNTITNWVSTGDFNGMEIGTTQDGEALNDVGDGSLQNYIQGIVINPLSAGIVMMHDGDLYPSQVVRGNEIHLSIWNSIGKMVYIENGFNYDVSYNRFDINGNGSHNDAQIYLKYNVTRNYFTGHLEYAGTGEYAGAIYIMDADVHDNTFEVTVDNNGAGVGDIFGGTDITNNIWRNCIFEKTYFSEYSGVVRDLKDGDTVAHNLIKAPTRVQLTPLNATHGGFGVIIAWDEVNTDTTNISFDVVWAHNGTAIPADVIDACWEAWISHR